VALEDPARVLEVVAFAAGPCGLCTVPVPVGFVAGVAAFVECGMHGVPLGDALVAFPAQLGNVSAEEFRPRFAVGVVAGGAGRQLIAMGLGPMRTFSMAVCTQTRDLLVQLVGIAREVGVVTDGAASLREGCVPICGITPTPVAAPAELLRGADEQ